MRLSIRRLSQVPSISPPARAKVGATPSTSPTRRGLVRAATKQRFRKYPSLGIIRLDYNYPAAVGDIDCPDSYAYPVFYRAVPGLTFEMCQSGKLSKEVAKEFDEAVRYLAEEKNVSAITGDCGFMMWFQNRARMITKVPIVLSALTQLPSLALSFHGGTLIIMTANSKSLNPMKKLIRKSCGIDLHDKRLNIVGCQDVPHFGAAVAKGLKVDVEMASPGIVDCMRKAVHLHPDAVAILMECTELPPYSEAVRKATGLPVFDAITNCNSVMAARVGWQPGELQLRQEPNAGGSAKAQDENVNVHGRLRQLNFDPRPKQPVHERDIFSACTTGLSAHPYRLYYIVCSIGPYMCVLFYCKYVTLDEYLSADKLI